MTKEQLIKEYGLNHEQAAVVLNNDKELIVPAGAGSGKTKTLVTKVIHLLKSGVDLENFLVLTFTNKAAAEMKERIKKMLKEEGLFSLVNKIDSANISTFDGFAYNFVKQNASLIGLDSNLELLDGAILATIKEDIAKSLVYEIMADEKSPYFLLLQNYTRKNDESILISNLVNVYEKLIALDQINNLRTEQLIVKDLLFNDFNLEEQLKSVSFEYVNNNQERIAYYNSYFKHLMTNSSFKIQKINNKYQGVDEVSKKKINKIFEPLDKLLKADVTHQDLISYYQTLESDLKLIIELLKVFDQKLENFKNNNNKYEFRDIANFLNQILKDNPNTLKRLKQKTKYVFVDEYQDTSLVQSTFLKMLVKDNSNIKILYVGDIKQSIYKFRDAKPETFINKQNEVTSIGLSTNYRSSSLIIDFVNDIFANILMSKEKHDIIYKNNHEMISGSTKYLNDGNAGVYLLELNSLENKGNVLEEAFVIGQKIKELMEQKIAKKYSDFAILIRKTKQFQIFADVFKYLDIPLQVQKDYNLRQTYLMKLIVNILNLSLNLNKENYNLFKFTYFSLLRSELIMMSDYELFKLFNSDQFINFNENDEIYKRLIKVKNAIYTKSNYQIIKTVLDEFNVNKAIIKTPKAYEKNLQINYLYNIAKPLGDLGITGLEFVKYLEGLAYDNTKLEQKILQDEKDNSVKLTNIHQSKGLEYEILFLADLDRKMGGLLNEHFGYENIAKFFGKITTTNQTEVISSVIKTKILEIEDESSLKEELRLLYTAITRAERMLFILGTPKEDYSNLLSFNDYLYYFGIKKIIKDENIIGIDEKLAKADYFLNLSDENRYYPKVLDELKQKTFDFKRLEKEEQTASVTINRIISDDLKNNLIKGTMLHEQLEYGSLFDKLLNKQFISGSLDSAIYYKELPFYLEDDQIIHEGVIDLVIELENEIYIIDYKTYDIDPNKYEEQLLVYEKYIQKIYPNKEIIKYLYSIVKNELIKVL